MNGCDCAADREQIEAGSHLPGCSNAEGEPDEPSDHYDQ